MVPLIRMFTLLHHVCTRILGKVQMKKTPGPERIVVLERYVQRYVLIRVFIYTISRERRARPQEWVAPSPGVHETRGGAKIYQIPEDLRLIP